MGVETALMLGAAGSVYGAKKQSDAAKKAGKYGADSAAQSLAFQREAIEAARAASEPFRFAGQQSINPLLGMLGLPSIQTPQQPIFNMQTGQLAAESSTQQTDRIALLTQQLEQLREMQKRLGG